MTNLTLLYKLLNLSADCQAAHEHATECANPEVASALHDCGVYIAQAIGLVVTERTGTARTLVDAAIATKAGVP